jgi:nucleotide-binding universal stress UspA family protein
MALKQRSATSPQSRAAEGAQGLEIFRDILCGVDGTRTAYEAVRQAASLVTPAGELTLLAVAGRDGERGHGKFEQAALAPVRAQRVLEYAERIAREAGARTKTEVESRGPVRRVLLERAGRHSLLALGAPSMSRIAHIMVGGVASTAAHLLPSSLLIARRPPAGLALAERIIVASDARESSDDLVGFALALARGRGASLQILHAAGAESEFHPTRISRQAESVGQALGERARMCVIPGRAHDVIVQTAARERASLLILGNRRLGGPRALGSVSERVVHDAPCSTLVVRPEQLAE